MKAIPNPEYEACRKHLCVGYIYNCGQLFPVTDAAAQATPEEIEASWQRFDDSVKRNNPYEKIHVGPPPK